MTDARHATNCASLQDVRGCGPCTCGVPDARGEPMTREALQRVTAQIRAWDKQSVAFDAAIQQIHAHDAAQRETIARLQQELIGKERAGTVLVEKISELQARLTASEAKRKWTTEKPTAEGEYWFRSDATKPITVSVYRAAENDLIAQIGCNDIPMDDLDAFDQTEDGEWQGPLTPGEE